MEVEYTPMEANPTSVKMVLLPSMKVDVLPVLISGTEINPTYVQVILLPSMREVNLLTILAWK